MNACHDIPYLRLAREIMEGGATRGDRTHTGTQSVFSRQLRFDLSDGSFPLLTAKQTPFRVVVEELLWFLRGETNIRSLVLKDVHIWNEWPYKAYLKKNNIPIPLVNSDEWKAGLGSFIKKIKNDESFALKYGELGPVYGSQWRAFGSSHPRMSKFLFSILHFFGLAERPIDQVARLMKGLKENPESRSHIVTAWDPNQYEWLRKNSLPPCHVMFQCYVANGKLSLDLTQRSCDYFLGVPFNIASYSALMLMLAHVTGLQPGEFIWSGKDVHLYLNHLDQTEEMLSREPKPSPQIRIVGNPKSLEDFTIDNFILEGYNPHPRIPAPVAV